MLILQPGQQRTIGGEAVRQQQVDAASSAGRQHLLDEAAGHGGLLALLRRCAFQIAPGDDAGVRRRDTHQRHDPLSRAQPGAIHRVDPAADQPPPIQPRHRLLLCRHPRPGLDPHQRVAQRIGMARQRLGLPPLGVAIARVVAFTQLHRAPPQLQ